MKKSKTKNNGDLDLSKKGQRLRYLRELAHLERREMADIARVAYVTYKDWENGITNLPDRRIRWIIDSLLSRGISCSVEWLTEGKGDFPKKQQFVWSGKAVFAEGKQALAKHADSRKQIMAELDFFCNNHANSIGLVVNDEGMLPDYAIDDVVGGIQLYKLDIGVALGRTCIVKLDNDTTLLRNLHKGREQGLYTLLCSNPNTPPEYRILHDVKLISAAPVIWYRTQVVVAK